MAFFTVKSVLRPVTERTAPGLFDASGNALARTTPGNARGRIKLCGYEIR